MISPSSNNFQVSFCIRNPRGTKIDEDFKTFLAAGLVIHAHYFPLYVKGQKEISSIISVALCITELF